MLRIRTSIAGLMAGVGFVALAIASLLNASPLWASCLFLFTVGLMSAAILGVIAGRPSSRITWAGFAIFGWVYLGIVFGPLKNGNATTIPSLPTTVVYETLLRGRVLPKVLSENEKTIAMSLDEAQTLSVYRQMVSMEIEAELLLETPAKADTRKVVLGFMMDLKRVVHSLGSILFALLGALVGRLFASRRFLTRG